MLRVPRPISRKGKLNLSTSDHSEKKVSHVMLCGNKGVKVGQCMELERLNSQLNGLL